MDANQAATLEALEQQIEQEEKALAALRDRTRTLEIEVAAWPARPKDLRPVWEAEMRRAKLEGGLGAICVGVLFGICWAVISLLSRRLS